MKKLFVLAFIISCSSFLTQANIFTKATGKNIPWQVGLAYTFGPDVWVVADRRKQVMPLIVGKHRRFYALNGNFGFNVIDQRNFSVGLNVAPRVEGFDPGDVHSERFTNNFVDRDVALEAGLRVASHSFWGDLELVAGTDISDKHEGETASLRYSYQFRNRGYATTPFISINYRSQEVIQYYWGLSEQDVEGVDCNQEDDPSVPGPIGFCEIYVGDDSFTAELGMNINFKISNQWHGILGASYEFYSSEIEDSPIVSESGGLSGTAGVSYSF
jgi:outer membrane scaffolding protein for murein synthesis (MipA/OmpV family)